MTQKNYLGICVQELRKTIKTSVKVAGVTTEIRRDSLPNTSPNQSDSTEFEVLIINFTVQDVTMMIFAQLMKYFLPFTRPQS
jgi:hypothetical protein